jgi:predicted metalloprotease with PDZ domain
MQYHIARKSPTSQFIEITLSLDCKENEIIHLQLAAWRPGRYELANYAQKIRGFQIIKDDKSISWKKISKDLWSFTALEPGLYRIKYGYYCNQMDAGACWSDNTQLYLNFSNFIFDIKERHDQKISLQIEIPENYAVATALSSLGQNRWEAENYQQAMDSPLLASEQLNHFSYQVNSSNFHLWFNGSIHFDIEKLIQEFKKFTALQIESFGDFPASDYHFIFQLLPYKHYHGVEHAYSTVITIGPAENLAEKKELDELFGVSSHELYHFWNVCRIRPKALMPYDLSKETYLDTGLVIEGVTTYMGDLFLLKSGYFSLKDYLLILEKQIQKELDNFGWKNQSIVESGFDLWLDGYKPGIPGKKVSIYNRGALLALCLDLLLLDSGSSLSSVMKVMWEKFGKPGLGYVLNDFENIIAVSGKETADGFFRNYVYGHEDISTILFRLLESIGIEVKETFSEETLLHNWGIRTDDQGKITQIHPESPAYQMVMLDDQILNFEALQGNYTLSPLKIEVLRWGRKLTFSIPMEKRRFFPIFKLSCIFENDKLKLWMG